MKPITRADILTMDEYAKIRTEKRAGLIAHKKNRRLAVGEHVTFYFEDWQTVWFQIHEMLFIEKGGDDQIVDELRAYAPLVPQGRELVATVMVEVADVTTRRALLAKLGGFEETMELRFAGHVVRGMPETDVDRTTAEGKASSVQFIHFPFTAEQVLAFRAPHTDVVVAITHPAYDQKAVMSEIVRTALAADFSA